MKKLICYIFGHQYVPRFNVNNLQGNLKVEKSNNCDDWHVTMRFNELECCRCHDVKPAKIEVPREMAIVTMQTK